MLQVVSPVDPRIHFTLVCGAKSCPPIKLYSPETLEEGLTAAAETFIAADAEIDKVANKVNMVMVDLLNRNVLWCSRAGTAIRIAALLLNQIRLGRGVVNNADFGDRLGSKTHKRQPHWIVEGAQSDEGMTSNCKKLLSRCWMCRP